MGNNSYKQAQKPKPRGKIAIRSRLTKINGAVKQNSKKQAATFAPIKASRGKISQIKCAK